MKRFLLVFSVLVFAGCREPSINESHSDTDTISSQQEKKAYGEIRDVQYSPSATFHISSEEEAEEILEEIGSEAGLGNAEFSCRLVNAIAERKYYQMQQMIDDIPISSCSITLDVAQNGNLDIVSGSVYIGDAPDMTNLIPQDDAILAAQQEDETCKYKEREILIWQGCETRVVYIFESAGNRIAIDAQTGEILASTSLTIVD